MTAKTKTTFYILLGVTGGLLFVFIGLLVLRAVSPATAEFVSRYIARPWLYVAGHAQSVFPFSVFEVFVLAVIGGVIALIVLGIIGLIKKRWYAVCKGLAIVCLCVVSALNLYTLTAGFAYYRPAAPVPQSETAFTSSKVTDIVRAFADDYNELADRFERDEQGNVLSPYTIRELSDKLRKEFDRLDSDYYYAYTPRAKSLWNSWFLTLNNITGITFVPFGEPTVNRNMPASDLPQTMAHEMAHAKGVAREGEANFVSYYVLLSSDDDYLRYCGYFATFSALLPAVNADSSIKTEYLEIRNNMHPMILREQQNAYRFWAEKSEQPGFAGWLNRTFEKIGDFVNDLFLKSNGADNGSGSYGDKVNDGSVTDSGNTNPDTGEIIYDVTYSSVQKMYFAIYENRRNAQA